MVYSEITLLHICENLVEKHELRNKWMNNVYVKDDVVRLWY
jgi:hypothetical protein